MTLSDTSAARPTFIAPSGSGSLVFRLTVTDGRGGSDTDDVTIVKASSSPSEPPSPLGGAEDEAETWGSWSDTGSTRGCGPDHEKKQSRSSNYGNTQTRWVSDPEPETWGSWSDTGRTQGSGAERVKEQSRTSNCGNTEIRWVGDSDLH